MEVFILPLLLMSFKNKKIKKQNLDIRNTYPLVMYTLLYLKQITNNDLLYSIWNCAQCYVAIWMGGGFVVEWIHVYIWLSPFVVHLKLSHHH